MFDTIQNICSVIDKGTFFYATTKNWLVSSNFNLRKGSPVELNKLHFLTFIKEDPEFCYLHCFRKLLKIEVDITIIQAIAQVKACIQLLSFKRTFK